MKRVFKIRNKKTKEVLPENHYLYMDACVTIDGELFSLREGENEEGVLSNWIDDSINDDYEYVAE